MVNAHILIVEDNLSDQYLIRDGLKAGDSSVDTSVVEDGLEVLPFLRREGKYQGSIRPDLIVLDLNLPGKDGRQVLREIKRDPAFTCIPVVVFSSSDAQSDVRDVYTSAGNTYFTKPPDLDEYLRVVAQIRRYWLHLAVLPDRHGACLA